MGRILHKLCISLQCFQFVFSSLASNSCFALCSNDSDSNDSVSTDYNVPESSCHESDQESDITDI